MKPLPENPPIYARPKERWFENHRHKRTEDNKPDLSGPALTRTLMAMWHMLHDRTGRPLPTKPKLVKVTDKEWLKRMLTVEPEIMLYWGALCGSASPVEDVSYSWNKLMTYSRRPKHGQPK